MSKFIKKHILKILVVGNLVFTVIRVLTIVRGGYFGENFSLFLFGTEGIRYFLIIYWVFVVLFSKEDRKKKIYSAVVTVFLFFIGLIPSGHFLTIGALVSIQNSNHIQIRDDARSLFEIYDPETLFSNYQQRYPFNNPIPKSELPQSLQNEKINDVLVMGDYIFLEKYGASGLFRGFIIFREDSDVWRNDKNIMLIEGCGYCWKIRIIDGFYWYHGNPTDEDVTSFRQPLK